MCPGRMHGLCTSCGSYVDGSRTRTGAARRAGLRNDTDRGGRAGPRNERRGRAMEGVDLNAVWARALRTLLDEGVSGQQRAFLQMTQPSGLINDTILLAAPNDFAKEVIEVRLRPLIVHSLSQELGRPVRIAVMVDPGA